MIVLKETSRLGRKLKARTGSTVVGNAFDDPASSHDVGDTGPPRVRMSLSRPWAVNHDAIAVLDEDPRGRGVPDRPKPPEDEAPPVSETTDSG